MSPSEPAKTGADKAGEEDLLARRADFPILAKSTYLISHSLGAMHRGVFDSLRDYATMWAERGIRSWAEGWWAMPGTAGDVLADILGAPHGSIVMHQNVSVTQSIVAGCFDYRPPRNKIVYESLNFPTVTYVWEARVRDGAVVREVASPDGMTVPTEAMLDAIDEQTLLVPISHVLYKSAWLQDAKAIVAKAHSVGAMVMLDCYQSAGTVPFSLTELGVDFACGGSVKWLCGGPGAGWLYVRPDLRSRLEPRVTGWMAHKAPFDFAPGPIEYADTSYRFLHGSPAVPAMYAALPGYQVIREIGVAAIRRKSQRQTELLRAEALSRGLRVTSPADPARRGGTITLDPTPLKERSAPIDDKLGAAVVKTLATRDILVDFRPGAGIRVSPHFYNSDEELRLCLDAIVEVVRTRAYEKQQGGAAY